jgi:hypothetical protein
MHASAAVRAGQSRRAGATGASRRAGLARKASIVLVMAFVEAILVAGLVAATVGMAFEASSRVVQTPVPAPPPVLNGR